MDELKKEFMLWSEGKPHLIHPFAALRAWRWVSKRMFPKKLLTTPLSLADSLIQQGKVSEAHDVIKKLYGDVQDFAQYDKVSPDSK